MAAIQTMFQTLAEYGNNESSTSHPITTTAASPPYPMYWGYICAIVAVILYGSNFVPVKKYYTGDGMFFQFVLCNGIFLVGFVVQLIQGSKFYPLVMLGGVIWATGNLCVVPIIKTIGMGLGLSLWGTVSLLAGWASGKFGWFDTTPNQISHTGLNYAGVALAGCSILLYVLVKDEISSAKPQDTEVEVEASTSDREPLLPTSNIQDPTESLPETTYYVFPHAEDDRTQNRRSRATAGAGGTINQEEGAHSALHDDRLFFEDFPPNTKKLTGVTLCVFSGLCYGFNFMPAIYVQDNYTNASQNGLDYVFAQFCGIYLAASIYFYIYCCIKKNSPKVYPKVILPGVVSGILWAIATSCWFVANAELSPAVSFPIVSTGPSAVASLFWGVCIFGEVRGLRNILILVAGFLVMSAGAVLSGLSR